MGYHGHDFVPQVPAHVDEGLETEITDIVVTHEDEAHSNVLDDVGYLLVVRL
jgi:hypothetical protein